MNTISINNVEYFHTADLMTSDKDYFKCCKGKPRAIIEWKKIPESEYIFAYQKDNQWVVSKKEYNKAYLLLTKSFCEANLPSMKVEPEVEEPKPEPKKIVKRVPKVKDAPPVLQLADSEKFKDEEGRPLDIEVRGERSHDKIYFKVKDVAIAFEMHKLQDTLTDLRRDGYHQGKHHVWFYRTGSDGGDKIKELYLTYHGMIRCLFVSKNKNAELFQTWALQILFVHQMGTIEQKEELICDMIGVPYCEVKKLLSLQSSETFCVYLSILGTVSQLRTSMKISDTIPDDSIVCKFGKTDNLAQRIVNHKSEFKSVKGIQWQLKKIATIDPCHGYEAERELKNFVKNYKFDFDNREELIIVSPSDLTLVEDRMKLLRLNYGTKKQELDGLLHILKSDLIKKEAEIVKKETEIQRLKFEFQSKEYYYKIKENDLASELRETKMRAEFEKKLCEKELKIYQLENEALKAKLK